MNFWSSDFWSSDFWSTGFWGDAIDIDKPWSEAPVQPGAFAPLSRPSSPIARPFQRRSKKRREEEFLLL